MKEGKKGRRKEKRKEGKKKGEKKPRDCGMGAEVLFSLECITA